MPKNDINEYWAKREAEHIKKRVKDDKKIAKEVAKRHKETMDDIQEQIEAFYGRYASTEGLTIEEARKRVAKMDIEAYKKKAKQYVKGAHSDNEALRRLAFSPRANEEMRLYNVTMKINRLELLKMHTNIELISMTNDVEAFLYRSFYRNVIAEYEHMSAILGLTINHSERHVKNIVNSSFMNAKWSERLWMNQNALRDELSTLLQRGIVQGRNPRELARDLRKTFDVSVANSERLLRTEMARIQQDVFEESAKQAKIEKYEYIAEPTACPICAALDGKVFDVKDRKVGINAYPMHPNCRCSQAMHVDREAWEKSMKARGL